MCGRLGRVCTVAQNHSDLDLALVSERPLPMAQLARLSYGFEEPDLPFRVDLVELNKVESTFRARIERRHEVIQVGNGSSEFRPWAT